MQIVDTVPPKETAPRAVAKKSTAKTSTSASTVHPPGDAVPFLPQMPVVSTPPPSKIVVRNF